MEDQIDLNPIRDEVEDNSSLVDLINIRPSE